MIFLSTFGSDFMDKIYMKPYARMGPYIVGLLLGYIINSIDRTKFKIKQVYDLENEKK
jgi:hypothetical protein